MEKPHPLYAHTSSFKFSSSSVRRSSARPDSISNETSKKPAALQNLPRSLHHPHWAALFLSSLFTHSLHLKVGPGNVDHTLPLLPEHQRALAMETLQRRSPGGGVLSG